MVVSRVVFFMVNAHYDRDVFFFRRSGDDNFFRACSKMSSCFVSLREDTRRFNNDVYTEFAPRQVCRVSFSKNFDLFAVYVDAAFACFYFSIENAMYRVVFEKVRERFSVREVVDRYDLDVCFCQGCG